MVFEGGARNLLGFVQKLRYRPALLIEKEALSRKGGRAAERGGLENRYTARYRGFESHPFRQALLRKSP